MSRLTTLLAVASRCTNSFGSLLVLERAGTSAFLLGTADGALASGLGGDAWLEFVVVGGSGGTATLAR